MTANKRFANAWDRGIKHFGQTLTFTRNTEGTYDPSTGTTPTTTTTFTGIGAESRYTLQEMDGERILQGDKKLLISAMDTPPEIGDVVDVNGISHKVITIMPRNSAGTVIGYDLQVRV